MKENSIETVLERILQALEMELIAASDEEVAEAAADLGFKSTMRGSGVLVELIRSPLRTTHRPGNTGGNPRNRPFERPGIIEGLNPPKVDTKRTK